MWTPWDLQKSKTQNVRLNNKYSICYAQQKKEKIATKREENTHQKEVG
jgi:hypothetical protein